MPIKQSRPSLSDKEARSLAKQIVKDNPDARVKFGATNGRPVLHVAIPGSNTLSCTVASRVDWEAAEANQRKQRNAEMAATQETEALMASNTQKVAA